MNKYDAVVIGSGIMGVSVALELARRGWRTLNVDKLPAAGYGSTSNSCAVISVRYSTLEGTAVAYESYFHRDRWAQYLETKDPAGLAGFIKKGILVIKSEINGHLVRMKSLLDQLNIAYEDWDAARLIREIPIYSDRAFWPVRRPDDDGFGLPAGGRIGGAVFYPSDGFISDPQLSTHNVKVAAEDKGAELRFLAEVASVLRKNGRTVGVALADGTQIFAPVVVNAAGPHSSVINRLAGIEEGMRIKTRTLRHEVVHLPAPPGFGYEARLYPISDSDSGCYSRPETGDHILCGSEDPPCDPQNWIEDPDGFDRNLTGQARIQAMRLAQRIPGLGLSNRLKGLADLYDVTDDWIPIYDKSDLPGFYLCIGTSGNQYKNAPVVGKMMAALIEAVQAGRDHDADPLGFRLDHVGRTISLGFYSRLREINRESSFSVLG